MKANRQQIRLELEVRRLRTLLKQKEALLDTQRQLCNGTMHERLHSQHKAVIVARQGLTATSAQCMEIGRSVVGAGEGGADFRCDEVASWCGDSIEGDFSREMGFAIRLLFGRLTEEGSEGLGTKFKQYKGAIGTYKDLRDKIRKGVFTIADTKEKVESPTAVVGDSSNKPLCSNEVSKVTEEGSDSKANCDAQPAEKEKKQDEAIAVDGGGVVLSNEPPKAVEEHQGMEVVENKADAEKEEEEENQMTKAKVAVVPEYKSPLEHMEYLE